MLFSRCQALSRLSLKGPFLTMMAAGMFVLTGIALYYLHSMPPSGFSDITHSFFHLLKANLPPLAFVGAMIVIPLVGFPISFFGIGWAPIRYFRGYAHNSLHIASAYDCLLSRNAFFSAPGPHQFFDQKGTSL